MTEKSDPEQLRLQARRLACERFDLSRDVETDILRAYPSIHDQIASSGLMRYCVPERFGGREEVVRCTTLCAIREGLAYANPIADLGLAVQGLGSYPLSLAANDRLKSSLLPLVANGKVIAAFAVTEREAGSDILSIQTTANRSGDAYQLNGHKTFISNAGIADFYIVFARTDPAGGRKALSAFAVRRDAPGLQFNGPIEMMAPHPIGEITFSQCRVPLDQLIGAEGDGFEIAVKTLEAFRPTVGAAAVGMAERAFDEARRHAQDRTQFGRAIAEFEGIQFKLADMATELDAARLLVYRAAAKFDERAGRTSREASMAKLFATEAAQRIIDQAMQIQGGEGLKRGTVVERLYREIRALRIYEGTSEIQRNIIAREIINHVEG